MDLVQLASNTVKLSSFHIKMVKFATNSVPVRPNIVIFKIVYVFGEKNMPWQGSSCFRFL